MSINELVIAVLAREDSAEKWSEIAQLTMSERFDPRALPDSPFVRRWMLVYHLGHMTQQQHLCELAQVICLEDTKRPVLTLASTDDAHSWPEYLQAELVSAASYSHSDSSEFQVIARDWNITGERADLDRIIDEWGASPADDDDDALGVALWLCGISLDNR